MKKFLLILLAIIFAPIWLLIILGHFITYPIVQRKIKKERKKNKYWNERVYKSDRCQIFLTRSHDLMVAFHHYYDELNYDDDERKYAKEVSIHFGGLHVFWKYGHKFLDKTKWSEDSKTKYYGLYCIDGWYGCWDNIWWGTHIYDLFWRRCKWCGTYVWSKNDNMLMNTNDACCRDYPTFRVDYNTTYINKNNEKQNVPKITWMLVERDYESQLLRWLGIAKFFRKRYIELEFDCDNNGDKNFSGLGINADSWKGGTYGSGIKITKETEPKILNLYNKVVRKQNYYYQTDFMNLLHTRIEKFMTKDKLY